METIEMMETISTNADGIFKETALDYSARQRETDFDSRLKVVYGIA